MAPTDREKQGKTMWVLSHALLLTVVFVTLVTGTAAKADDPNINDLVGQLDFETADINDIIEIFGEPMEYVWGGQYFTRENLPQRYVVRYPYGFNIWMLSGRIRELRFESLADDYLFRGKIHIGSSLEEVLEVIGGPEKTVRDRPCGWEGGVLYEDIDKIEGYCYYSRPDQHVRLFFKNYRVTALYLTGDAEGQEPSLTEKPAAESDTAEPDIAEPAVAPNINDSVAQFDFESATLDEVIRIFGEPMDYFWMGRIYRRNNLPQKYLARYSDGFSVVMDSDRVSELRFESANSGYLWGGLIEVGSSLDEVLEAAGEPTEVLAGRANEQADGVLYKDIDGREGYCYYSPAEENVKFYFLKNKVVALHLTSDDEYRDTAVSDELTIKPGMAEGEITELNINERVEQLDFEKAGLDDVVRIFGEPMGYFWRNQLYTKDNLPRQYLAKYSDGFSIWVRRGKVKELRFKSADIGYVWRGGIETGSSLDEVLEVAGEPTETIIGEVNEWVDGVLYKDINGREGYCYYRRADLNVRFFFRDYGVSALYLTGSAGYVEAEEANR